MADEQLHPLDYKTFRRHSWAPLDAKVDGRLDSPALARTLGRLLGCFDFSAAQLYGPRAGDKEDPRVCHPPSALFESDLAEKAGFAPLLWANVDRDRKSRMTAAQASTHTLDDCPN